MSFRATVLPIAVASVLLTVTLFGQADNPSIPPIRVYTYPRRRDWPDEIAATGHWDLARDWQGDAQHCFIKLTHPLTLAPETLQENEIPYAVPEIVDQSVGQDEQGIVTRARYNRLVDVFTGLAAFHLQSHVRTVISRKQIEIDDLYVAVDKQGKRYCVPIEAKTGREKTSYGQVSNMAKFAETRFPDFACRPLLINGVCHDLFHIVEFIASTDPRKIRIVDQRLYRLAKDADD